MKYINGAGGHAYGLEFLLNKNLTDKWYGWMSVAYSKTKREYDASDERFTYLYDPSEGRINSERLPAKHGLDFRIDYKKSEMTDVYFEIINAYSHQNITEYEYSDDYSTREGVSELETLFSIGAKFTF